MYIVRCQTGSYYVGKANDLHFRMREHSGAIPSNRLSRYVTKNGFDGLVYFEEFETSAQALKRESELKKWHPKRYLRGHQTPIRAYKDYLVKNFPAWKVDAFHATTTDAELRRRLKSREPMDFVPMAPGEWWDADTKSRPEYWYAHGESRLAEAAQKAFRERMIPPEVVKPPGAWKNMDFRWKILLGVLAWALLSAALEVCFPG